MSGHQYATIEDSVFLYFAANDTSGSGGDGASPLYDVRLAGDTAGAAPIDSGTPTLLTHANYPAGAHEVAVAATVANGFAATNTYGVFCTLLVDSQNPTGFVGSFKLDPVPSNVLEISDDATSADNLELQYDTTGLSGGTFPSTQEQVSQIGSGGGSANNEFPILSPNGFVITTGSSEVNNEDATRAVGGDVHQISDTAGTMDVYYLFDIGGSFSPNTIVHEGRMGGNNQDVGVYVNTNTQASPTWVQRATLEGQASTVNLRRVWPLVTSDQMVGADAGKVAVRFQATGLSTATLTTDQVLVEKTSIASVLGYENGQVWVNTVSGTAGTVVNVNGVGDKAVLTWADAITISGSAGLANDFHVINGSTIALTGTSDNFSIFGDNWTLQLASRSVAGAYFQGAHVSGVGTSATEVHYEGCDVATMSVQIGHFDFCSFSGTVTHTLAGDYNYHNCYSMVAGPNGPTFAKTAGQAITAQWRGWKGSINLTGLEVGDTLTIGGDELGTIDLGSPAGAVVVEVRGIYKELTNIGSAAVNLEGAINAADVALILADTNSLNDTKIPHTLNTTALGNIGIDWANVENKTSIVDLSATDIQLCDTVASVTALAAGAIIVGAFATDSITAAALATDAVTEIVDGVLDEVNTGGTHNVGNSVGKQIREASETLVITSGTAQGPGTSNNQIQLAAGESAVDGAFDPAFVTIVGGLGMGQSRLILQYDGATKTATVDRSWKVNPDVTTEYIIVPSAGREHVNEGLAQAGAAGTITLNALASSDDNAYNGQVVFIRSGLGEDQARWVTAYNGTTKVATVDRNWDVTPDTTSGYVMLPTGLKNLSVAETGDQMDLIDSPNATAVTAIQSGLATATNVSDAHTTTDALLAALQNDLPNAITKNVAVANFPFLLVLSSDHVTPATGKSVTAERSIDGAAFSACANSVTELSDGVYIINLAASDLNGDTIFLKFTAAATDTRNLTIITQPT